VGDLVIHEGLMQGHTAGAKPVLRFRDALPHKR
jgi:hypothetical protein